ncbi:hypothetical protein [Oryzifoliimicrobium ureilyticus]|uniref:hypothetical protein n=1 Tax=Oryzifoliimicrobium ureilyticus TaxID=3113724 RepID=UPI00307646E3
MTFTPPLPPAFIAALSAIPHGYCEGSSRGGRWGASLKRSADGNRLSFFAEDLAGQDIVSFNLYRLSGGFLTLKPCEMSSDKVIEFVIGFQPDDQHRAEI